MFFWRKSQTVPTASPIYGVNLGGWLVLEKWMTPSVFSGDTIDEYGLCDGADEKTLAAIKKHRDTFITGTDFVWLVSQGISAVRLPVGYGVFGDEPPYQATIDYVDKAFAWAEETGIKILLDMHAAPGSQNGWDHSGRSGKVRWHKEEANIIKTLDVLNRLAGRYKDSPSLLGFELLNEPKWTVPRRKLMKYYEAAYRLIRAECGEGPWIVFHDSFRPRRWKRKLRSPEYANVFIDTHQYQTFSKRDKRLDLAGHLRKTLTKVSRTLAKMAKRHRVIVGEWSLALDPISLQGLNQMQQEAAYRAYGGAQLIAYERTSAWFYWSYKTEAGGVWSFRDAADKGWLPQFTKK